MKILKTPVSRLAHVRVKHAVDTGKLIKPDACQKCGKTGSKIHGHHEDYGKPLEVIWLCLLCHHEAHGRVKEANRRRCRHQKTLGECFRVDMENRVNATKKAKKIGLMLRGIRENSDVTVRGLAKKIGWTAMYISDIERGNRNLPMDRERLQVWANVIGAGDVEEWMKLAEECRPGRCEGCSLTKGQP